jgi:hypothetical protein
MLNKILFLACFFCVLAIYYLYNDNLYQKEQKAIYSSNNQLLIKKIREVYNDKVETDRTNEELRQTIAGDKTSGFNWYQDISNTAPIISLKRMHKDRNKIR